MAGIIISDHEYPALVAHQLLSKIMDEFLNKNPRTVFSAAAAKSINFPELKDYITKYQDPAQADSIMKIQKELDETKITLHKTIESVLERNVKLDDLVNKSEGLSSQSKMFYTQVCAFASCYFWAATNKRTLYRRRSKILAVSLCKVTTCTLQCRYHNDPWMLINVIIALIT